MCATLRSRRSCDRDGRVPDGGGEVGHGLSQFIQRVQLDIAGAELLALDVDQRNKSTPESGVWKSFFTSAYALSRLGMTCLW